MISMELGAEVPGQHQVSPARPRRGEVFPRGRNMRETDLPLFRQSGAVNSQCPEFGPGSAAGAALGQSCPVVSVTTIQMESPWCCSNFFGDLGVTARSWGSLS